jgi:hypothetical protein
MTNEKYLKKLESFEIPPDWYPEVFDNHTGKMVKAAVLENEDGVKYAKCWGNTYFVDEVNGEYVINTKYGLCRI